MTNFNKIYHKGKYRSGEWAKHLRPYLKRVANKRFRKDALTIESDEYHNLKSLKKWKIRRKIKAKITLRLNGNSKTSYYKNYRNMKDLNNAVKRPNVIRYMLVDGNSFD